MNQPIDAFVCVHERDATYLFEMTLRSYMLNFAPKGRLTLVTNNQPHLAEFVARLGLEQRVTVTGDSQWLSQRELTLPGWYKQQIIKLRAYEFCETDNFCNLGADTVLLQPIVAADLIDGDFPILYYRRHMPPTIHLSYEYRRVLNIGRLLQVRPLRALRYGDFISDLFCFNRDALQDLNAYLSRNYGSEPFYTLLHGYGSDAKNYVKFGEWTLYSVYLLDVLKRQLTLRNSAAGFLHQVHSARSLRGYRFDSRVVHFVSKGFDVEYIQAEMARRGITLSAHMSGPVA